MEPKKSTKGPPESGRDFLSVSVSGSDLSAHFRFDI